MQTINFIQYNIINAKTKHSAGQGNIYVILHTITDQN